MRESTRAKLQIYSMLLNFLRNVQSNIFNLAPNNSSDEVGVEYTELCHDARNTEVPEDDIDNRCLVLGQRITGEIIDVYETHGLGHLAREFLSLQTTTLAKLTETSIEKDQTLLTLLTELNSLKNKIRAELSRRENEAHNIDQPWSSVLPQAVFEALTPGDLHRASQVCTFWRRQVQSFRSNVDQENGPIVSKVPERLSKIYLRDLHEMVMKITNDYLKVAKQQNPFNESLTGRANDILTQNNTLGEQYDHLPKYLGCHVSEPQKPIYDAYTLLLKELEMLLHKSAITYPQFCGLLNAFNVSMQDLQKFENPSRTPSAHM